MNSNEGYKNIPQELRELRQWVCFRFEERDGKKTKIPYCVDGKKAKSNDPSTWHTFEEVVKAVRKTKNRFDGIGFMLAESDPYVFIDLDHVVNDGVVEEWANEIVERVDSYTEFSQSGTGIHIIARAQKPGPRCRTSKYPKFEMYGERRLIIFIGKLYGTIGEIREAQRAIEEIYFEVFGEGQQNESTKETRKDARPLSLSDQAIIGKAMSASNGDKFSRLWRGDISDYNGDDSAADMALCCMLAFWTRKDPIWMDRLFRQSGLMRRKWDEPRGPGTYGEQTIEKAIQSTREVYEGSHNQDGKHKVTEEDELVYARQRIAKAKELGTAKAVFNVASSLALLSQGEYLDIVTQLKKSVPQLDLRALKGAVSRTKKSHRAGGSSEYPELVVNNRQLRDAGDEAIRLLNQSNIPPTLFVRSGALCQVVEDECRRPNIRSATEEIILSLLAKACDLIAETDDGPKNVSPPKNIASYVLSEGKWPFPALEAITRSPTLRPDGSVTQQPGYDPETRLFYHRTGDEEIVEVPENPTCEDVKAALELIEELLHDFPLDCKASRANTIALLLSPVIQPAIKDVTPLFLINAPAAGSGKSLLANVAGIISTGSLPDLTTAPTKEEEWGKKITALLSGGPSLVVIDNVKYTLQSADLAMILTARTWKERVFGKNTESVVLPNCAIWVVTGNNVQLGGDMPRRCVQIRIDTKHPKPHERDSFLHSNLKQWVSENRGRLLSALLTLCRAWYAAGCPSCTVPAFGSFEAWTRTVGGILAHAGVEGFLENREQMWEQADTESFEWEAFLERWLDIYGNTPITPKELMQDIVDRAAIAEAIPVSISDAVSGKGNSFARIGYQLKARLGKRYGPRGLRLERGPRMNKGVTWMVVAEDDPTECRDDGIPCTDPESNLSLEEQSSVEYEKLETPNAGEKGIISVKEIIPSEYGLDSEKPAQPSTLHTWNDEYIEEF